MMKGPTLSFATTLGQIEITICTPRLVRVRLAPAGVPEGPSYVAVSPDAWSPVAYELRDGPPLVVDTGVLTVRVDVDALTLEFAHDAGAPTLRVPIAGGLAGESVRRRAAARPDAPTAAVDGDEHARITARFDWVGAQHFFALGEGGKQFDRLGGARQLWNSHFVHGTGSDIGVPLLLSSRGYGLFFDNAADAQLVVGRSDGREQIVYRVAQAPLQWYYLGGRDLREVLGDVAQLLGHAPLPPRWALGYQQSTRHFDDANEVLALPRTLREKRIPCDALIFLSTYGDGLGWNRGVGHLEFQPDIFPEPAAMLAEFRAQGFQVITHEYPVLHHDSPLVAEALRRGYLLDEGYERIVPDARPSTNFHEGQRYLDFSNADLRAWWWAQHRALADLGVAGWWLDGGEGPSAAARLQGGDGLALHNLYDRQRQQAFAEGEAADYPERRVFSLCRSGAAGMQRYGASCWSGDINNTFATLEAQIPLGLNTGMSGIPYWGTDIGGFFHPLPESGELFARWFQFGAFCPIFRAHGFVWRDHLPWAHGPEVEAICRRYAELRYQLLPYTYTLAWQAQTLGLPLMRPLVLNYPQDPAVWELGSEYLWGDDLLVAPVTREGATAWPVYLPSGGWYDFWTQQRYSGPAGLTAEAPLDRLPLFVRAGAILPLAPLSQFDGERAWDEITLLIYPDGESQRDLYDDDGSTNAYLRGQFAVTTIRSVADPARITVHIAAAAGDHASVPSGRTYTLQVLGDPPSRVLLDGQEALPRHAGPDEPGPCYWHDGRHFTHVRLLAAQATVTLER
jgi:alpha-glucosidase (family GH31 glycosyl hydrolase)